ncbi:hypothetical protein Ddye_032209 [Dipteronia dyeriana]|uniref:Uncharacterized protein n=1 Tax=Dipteronia dyeriana TaxID=168575 RepID=A0AAD9TJT8_9ROSI|nr:hypothetical protein Ddye_032209 [Dipteronia dyeriana]
MRWKRAARKRQAYQKKGGTLIPFHRGLALSSFGKKISKGNNSSPSGKKVHGQNGKGKSPIQQVRTTKKKKTFSTGDSIQNAQKRVSSQVCKRKLVFDLPKEERE